MIQRYAHLSPTHLAATVERIVAMPAVVVPRTGETVELGLDGGARAARRGKILSR